MLELLERQQRLSLAALVWSSRDGRPGRDSCRVGQPIWPMRCDSGALRLRRGDGPVVALLGPTGRHRESLIIGFQRTLLAVSRRTA
jgi:hypothetical protein